MRSSKTYKVTGFIIAGAFLVLALFVGIAPASTPSTTKVPTQVETSNRLFLYHPSTLDSSAVEISGEYCAQTIAKRMYKDGVDTVKEVNKSGVNGRPGEILTAMAKDNEKKIAAKKAAEAAKKKTKISGSVSKGSFPSSGGVMRWKPLFVKYFKSNAAPAMRVCAGESGGNPNAVGPGGRGLMQINPCHARKFREVTGQPFYPGVFDPKANIMFAAYMTNEGRNWSSWSVQP